MAKQTEIFDEVDRLRDELRQTEEMGREIAERLTDERAKNAALSDELNRLRNVESTGETFAWLTVRPNTIMIWCVLCGFNAMMMSSPGMDVGPAPYPNYIEIGAILRFLAQLSFFFWGLLIYKRDGMRGMFKRMLVWTIAWAGSMWLIAVANRGTPELEYQLVAIANPANWWTVPFVVKGDAQGWIVVLFFAAADVTADFAGSRWTLQKLMGWAERLKEAIQ